jgi:hypothetical protein
MRLLPSCIAGFALLAACLVSPLVAHGEDAAKFVGAYYSHSHDAGRSGAFMNLSLGYDRTATLTEDPGTGNTQTLFGHWISNGNTVTITFDPQDGKPAEPPMNFTMGKDGLEPVTWNHAYWGKETPPAMKKGGAKVKERYWLTTNP